MSKPKIDKATGENKSGYSNINRNNITEFISNKDKLLVKLVRFIDLSFEVLELCKDIKSDFDKLLPLIKDIKK